LERAARVVAGSGGRADGASLVRLRNQLLELFDEAATEVEHESGMPTTPRAELMVVDRHGWIGGNLRTLERLFADLNVSGAEAKLVAWEGGAFVGLVARAVLGQFDPFRDQLVIVYPNLGEMASGDGLRWLMYHEVTHLAQFRSAPWIPDQIVEWARELLALQQKGMTRQILGKLPQQLPEIVRWTRQALEGKSQGTPLLDLLPEAQREAIGKLNALVTLLEGHATLITELIAKRTLPEYEQLQRRIEARRNRPPLMRLLEALAGLDMKRQQYVLGRSFCEHVWQRGGADALAIAWTGPDSIPTLDELREPQRWLDRVGAAPRA
jgi:coenzyme F420 biosynthesis associated uncharacterized protein